MKPEYLKMHLISDCFVVCLIRDGRCNGCKYNGLCKNYLKAFQELSNIEKRSVLKMSFIDTIFDLKVANT